MKGHLPPQLHRPASGRSAVIGTDFPRCCASKRPFVPILCGCIHESPPPPLALAPAVRSRLAPGYGLPTGSRPNPGPVIFRAILMRGVHGDRFRPSNDRGVLVDPSRPGGVEGGGIRSAGLSGFPVDEDARGARADQVPAVCSGRSASLCRGVLFISVVGGRPTGFCWRFGGQRAQTRRPFLPCRSFRFPTRLPPYPSVQLHCQPGQRSNALVSPIA